MNRWEFFSVLEIKPTSKGIKKFYRDLDHLYLRLAKKVNRKQLSR